METIAIWVDVGIVVHQQVIRYSGLFSYFIKDISWLDDVNYGAVVALGLDAESLRDERVTMRGTDGMQLIELTCPR